MRSLSLRSLWTSISPRRCALRRSRSGRSPPPTHTHTHPLPIKTQRPGPAQHTTRDVAPKPPLPARSLRSSLSTGRRTSWRRKSSTPPASLRSRTGRMLRPHRVPHTRPPREHEQETTAAHVAIAWCPIKLALYPCCHAGSPADRRHPPQGARQVTREKGAAASARGPWFGTGGGRGGAGERGRRSG